MKSAWTIAVVPALLFSAAAVAQDVRGLEICTAEKDMARRTSCLQANVEFLQQELTKQARRTQKQADDDRAAATKELTMLKTDIVALKILLGKAQDEIAAMKKKPAEKKMKTIMTVLGVLIAIAGLIWAAQGAGWFPYPASSFMVDNSRWIYIGLATAVGGVIVIALARRI